MNHLTIKGFQIEKCRRHFIMCIILCVLLWYTLAGPLTLYRARIKPFLKGEPNTCKSYKREVQPICPHTKASLPESATSFCILSIIIYEHFILIRFRMMHIYIRVNVYFIVCFNDVFVERFRQQQC